MHRNQECLGCYLLNMITRVLISQKTLGDDDKVPVHKASVNEMHRFDLNVCYALLAVNDGTMIHVNYYF